MKTIIIIANFCRKFDGTVNGRFLYLAEMFAKRGFRVELITSDFDHGTKKYKDEHYIIDDKELYVSGGIGTSSLKLRFFNKPSITLYRLRTK